MAKTGGGADFFALDRSEPLVFCVRKIAMLNYSPPLNKTQKIITLPKMAIEKQCSPPKYSGPSPAAK